ncbi:ABC transporter substrate-binding protein [Chitinimonas naiadis]
MTVARVLAVSLLALSGLARADIVLGQSVPISAVAGDSGRGLSLGVGVAIAEVNAAGGINGEKVRLSLLDDQGKMDLMQANTATLTGAEKALALVGYWGTPDPLASLLDREKIALVGAGAAITDTQQAENRHVFHLRPSYKAEVDKLASMIGSWLGTKRVGLLVQNDAFGTAVGNVANAELNKRGIKPLAMVRHEPSAPDLGPAAEALLRASPDVVIMISNSKSAGQFIKRFREMGGGAQLYSLSNANYEEVVELIGAETASGVGIVQVFPYPLDSRLKLARDYQAAMKAYAPKRAKLSYASMEGYIAGRTTLEAIRRAGKNPTRQSVLQALDEMRSYDLGGFVVDFADSHHVGAKLVDVTMISGTGNLSR